MSAICELENEMEKPAKKRKKHTHTKKKVVLCVWSGLRVCGTDAQWSHRYTVLYGTHAHADLTFACVYAFGIFMRLRLPGV